MQFVHFLRGDIKVFLLLPIFFFKDKLEPVGELHLIVDKFLDIEIFGNQESILSLLFDADAKSKISVGFLYDFTNCVVGGLAYLAPLGVGVGER